MGPGSGAKRMYPDFLTPFGGYASWDQYHGHLPLTEGGTHLDHFQGNQSGEQAIAKQTGMASLPIKLHYQCYNRKARRAICIHFVCLQVMSVQLRHCFDTLGIMFCDA